jgi:endo-1,4-beta-xylanase
LRFGGGPELTGVMKRRRLLPLCAGTLLGAAADPVRDQQGARPVQNRQSGTSGLGSRAAARGVAFGAALGSAQAAQHAPYREVVARECTLITPENEMKWHHLSARPGSYDFSGADWLADFARTNRKRLRGHTLLWHEGLPPWAEALDGWRIFEEAILRHIRTVGGRYRGQIGSWDVVNEPIRVEDGRGDGLRRQPFLDRIGPEYLALALHAARETDPSARLCINELNLEYDGPYFEDRRAALLRLVGELKAAGVPLDAVGIQSHLTVGAHPFSERRFRAFLAELASLQVEIQITELDVSDAHLPAALVERDRRVAEEYERYLTVALDERATNTVVTWGISDRYSWLNTPFAPPDKKRKDGQLSRPLPFDEGLHKKVAWEAIARAFDGAPAR